jgi:precorrin-3B synthase
MQSGDGLLLRLKPRLGVLTAGAAHAVADTAARLGNGMMGLTNRGNLQLRGFTAETAAAFATIAVEFGLAHPEPGAELRRNVLVSPLIGLDPKLDPATFDIARMMDDLLARRTEFAALPGKFGVVVCGGGVLPVAAAPGDVLIQPQGDLVAISLDGGEFSAYVPQADLRHVMQRLLLAFIQDGSHRRMRDANAATIFAKAGLIVNMPRQIARISSPIGALPGAFGIGISLGMFNAAQLHRLADLATQEGDGTLRLTPWRALILPVNVREASQSEGQLPGSKTFGLERVARNAGFIVDANDSRLRIEACPGAPSCASASVNTLEAANLIAAHACWDGTLHVSGCAKGCAHPGTAALTVVGDAGLWNIIRDGRASDAPLLRGCAIGSITEMAQRP